MRGLAANGDSISPTLTEVMNAIGYTPISFTLAASEEKDLGNLGYGLYLITSPENATTAIFSCGAYPICFVSDAGRNNYCDYTDGTKDCCFWTKRSEWELLYHK